jgi:uncharacterized repeat protein (TIGR01451 family)
MAAPTVTTNASATTTGGKVHDAVKVTGNAQGGAPTGTVAIHVCGPVSSAANCDSSTTGYTSVATATPTSGTKTTTNSLTTYRSVTFSPTSSGLWCFSSTYTPSATTHKYIAASDNTGATGKTNKTGQVSTPECVLTKGAPNFTVKKTDVPGTGKPVGPGSTIPYTVTVSNVGVGAGSAVLTDPLPENLALVATTATCKTVPSGDSCSASVTATKPKTLVFHVTLAAGHKLLVTFTGVVANPNTANVTNTVTITTGPCTPSTQCSSTVTNPPLAATAATSTTPATPITPQTLATTGGALLQEIEWALGLLLVGSTLVLLAARRRARTS